MTMYAVLYWILCISIVGLAVGLAYLRWRQP